MEWSELIHGVLKKQGIFFKLYQILGKVVTKEFLHSFLRYKKTQTLKFHQKFHSCGWGTKYLQKQRDRQFSRENDLVKNDLVTVLVK